MAPATLTKAKSKRYFRIIGIIMLGFLALYFISGGSNTDDKVYLTNLQRKVAIIAHRGASDTAPENTLAAIRKALLSPVDYIEVDIHQTKDGELILMHDATVNRTTNGQGTIADLTLTEIKKLDAGTWFDSAYQHEKVPTLNEVLEIVKGHKKLLIEIKKGDGEFYNGIEDKTLALIQKHRAQDWCVIQSFYDEVLEKIWQSELAVVTHKLIIGKLPWLPLYFDHRFRWGNFDKYDRAAAINAHQYFASKEFIKYVHNKGFKTFIWTVNDAGTINRVLASGADGVLTNNVSKLQFD